MADYRDGARLRVPKDNMLDPDSRRSRTFDVGEYSESIIRMNKCSGIAPTDIHFTASKDVVGTLLVPTTDGFVPAGAGNIPCATLAWYTYDPATDDLIFHPQTSYGNFPTVNDWSAAEGLLLYNDEGAITDVPVGRMPIAIVTKDGAHGLDAIPENRVKPAGISSDALTRDNDYRPVRCILWDGEADFGIDSMSYGDSTYTFTFDQEYDEVPTVVVANNDLSGDVAAVMLDEVTTTRVRLTLRNDSNQKIRKDDGFSLIGFTKGF